MGDNSDSIIPGREKEIDKVTLAGSLVNIALTALKFAVGFAGRSSGGARLGSCGTRLKK